jgi:hypothetical protein
VQQGFDLPQLLFAIDKSGRGDRHIPQGRGGRSGQERRSHGLRGSLVRVVALPAKLPPPDALVQGQGFGSRLDGQLLGQDAAAAFVLGQGCWPLPVEGQQVH